MNDSRGWGSAQFVAFGCVEAARRFLSDKYDNRLDDLALEKDG
jgi:hypothetical protein